MTSFRSEKGRLATWSVESDPPVHFGWRKPFNAEMLFEDLLLGIPEAMTEPEMAFDILKLKFCKALGFRKSRGVPWIIFDRIMKDVATLLSLGNNPPPSHFAPSSEHGSRGLA